MAEDLCWDCISAVSPSALLLFCFLMLSLKALIHDLRSASQSLLPREPRSRDLGIIILFSLLLYMFRVSIVKNLRKEKN